MNNKNVIKTMILWYHANVILIIISHDVMNYIFHNQTKSVTGLLMSFMNVKLLMTFFLVGGESDIYTNSDIKLM